MKSNQDRLEKFNEEIDAALKLLGETAPPAATISRIHQSLETAVITSQRARSGGRFWIPATCIAMAAVLVMLFHMGFWPAKTGRTVKTASLSIKDSAQPERASAIPVRIPLEIANNKSPRRRNHNREHARNRDAANLFNYPLTHQEKLLVQFARTATPDELKELNPEYQAKLEAQQEAEFTAYLNSGNDSGNSSENTTSTEANSAVSTTQE